MMKLFVILTLVGQAASLIAQDSERQWRFYENYREHQRDAIFWKHQVKSQEALAKLAQENLRRAEALYPLKAITERELRMYRRDYLVALTTVDGARAKFTTSSLNQQINGLKWRWEQGEDQDLQVLKKLYFKLWDSQCETRRIAFEASEYNLDYAEYDFNAVKDLVKTNVVSRQEFETKQRELIKQQQFHVAAKEIVETCEEGPPFP